MITSVIIGFFFIFSTWLTNKYNNKTILYLNLVVVFFTLNNFQIVLIDNVFLNSNYFIRNLLIPFYGLIVPAFYTFVLHYLKVEGKFVSYVRFFLILLLVEIGIRIVLFPIYYTVNQSYIVAKYSQIEEISNAFLSLFLFIKAIILIFNQTKLFKEITTYDSIVWLKKF